MTILLLMGLAILFGLAGLALVLYQIRKENRGGAIASPTPQTPVSGTPPSQSPAPQPPTHDSNLTAREDHR